MPAYDLPAVSTESLPTPSSYGKWVGLKNLDSLARSLRLDKGQARPDELKSIPDAWAQAQLASDAFFNHDHDAHEETVKQWRALLALFALQPIYSHEYDLQISTISLKGKGRRSRLRSVLGMLQPPSAGSTGIAWDQVGVVEFISRRNGSQAKRHATALLSPSILVSPGRMFASLDHQGVPWLNGGPSDPVERDDLPPEAWPILVRYLQDLVNVVRGAKAISDDTQSKLISQLRRYLDDCEALEQESLSLRSVQLPYEWPDPFYSQLGRTSTVDESVIEPGASDCRLRLRTGRATSLFRGAILVDSALSETLGKPAQRIRVWGRYTLADASSPATLEKIKHEARSAGFLVVEPSDFFSNLLVKFGDGAEAKGNPADFRGGLLPISPLALLFLTEGNWSRFASGRQVGDEAEAALSVSLDGDNGTTHHRVKRAFASTSIQTVDSPPDLAVWPNFEAEDWPWNFLRFQYVPTTALQARFGLSGDLLAADLEAAVPAERSIRLREWTEPNRLQTEQRLFEAGVSQIKDATGRLLMERFRFADGSRLVGEQQMLPHGLEAIFFSVRQSSDAAPLPAGCVVVQREMAPQSRDEVAVAIDFGTTNTVVYTARPSQAPQRLAFEDRVLFPVEKRDQETALSAAYTDFFPLTNHDTPIPTVAKKREFGAGSLTKDIRHALDTGSSLFGLSHNVFFMPRGGGAESPEFLVELINRGFLEFEIKWGDEASHRRLVQSFLRQLMVMIAAELRMVGVTVENLSWRFSFPQAFTHQQRMNFEAAVRQTWRQLGQDSTLLGNEDQRIAFRTEAAAAMQYFTTDPSQSREGVSRLVVMFDIGGGTTDMAVWREQQLVWRGSVRLAGSDFFRRYLINNMDVLEAVEGDAVRSFRANARGADALGADPEYRTKQLVELLVAKPSFSEAFQEQYPIHSGEASWAGLRQGAVTALGGLCHYVGLVLRSLLAEGKLHDRDMQEITVALGGRGSTMFRNLAAGGHDSELVKVCRLLPAAAGLDYRTVHVAPRFSSRPKEEVARGLLIAGDAGSDVAPASQILPSGLTIEFDVGSQRCKLTCAEDLKDLLSATSVREIDLDCLIEFLAELRMLTGLHVDIVGRNAERTIRQRAISSLNPVISQLTEEDRNSADTQAVEPPFVTALRYLVEIMTDPLESRDAKLVCRER